MDARGWGFCKEGTDYFYVGPVSKGRGPDPLYIDTMHVANVISLGKKGFDDLITKAIGNLNLKAESNVK